MDTVQQELKRILSRCSSNADIEILEAIKTFGELVNFIAEKSKGVPGIKKVYLDKPSSSMVVETISGNKKIPLAELEMMWALNVALHSIKKN